MQGNYAAPQSSQTSVTVPFSVAQYAGDLIVVVAGWRDSTAVVSTVTDTSGNAYARAMEPTIVKGALSQAIYYAKNIKASAANAVTVTFSAPATVPDIRILEYSGIDVNNPIDATSARSGDGSTAHSGGANTTHATDLLFAADVTRTQTIGPGSGFTSRILTSPDGDIAEDRVVTTAGNYKATANISPSGLWIMQMVAFRGAQ